MILRLFCAVFAVAILSCGAFAQSSVSTLGPVTYGHGAMFLNPQSIMDAGGPTTNGQPPVNNVNPGSMPLGYAWVNSGLGMCGFTGYANAPYERGCIGFSGNNLVISLDNFNGAPVGGMIVHQGGVDLPFPGAGNGNVIGPVASVVPNVAVFNNSTGTLLADSGIAIANLAPHVATNAALAASKVTSYPQGVWRDSFSPGVGFPQYYTGSPSPCLLNAGAGDNGTQTKSADTSPGCFIASPPGAIYTSQFGVSAAVADNAPLLKNASIAQWNTGLDLVIDSVGTIKESGFAIYTGPNPGQTQPNPGHGAYVRFMPGARLQAITSPTLLISTLATPTSTVPTLGQNITIDNFYGDQNNQDGTPLMMEGTLNVTLNNPITRNIKTSGTFIHNDGVATSGTYPNSAIMIKGISNVAGAYYATINSPDCRQPVAAANVPGSGIPLTVDGGIGIWAGTTSGGSGQTRANVLHINGGVCEGFNTNLYISAAGTLHVKDTDFSVGNTCIQLGGDGIPIFRAFLDKPYLEECPIGVMATSDVGTGSLMGVGSTAPAAGIVNTAAGYATCISNASSFSCDARWASDAEDMQPTVGLTAGSPVNSFIPSQLAGFFRVKLLGGGGQGGGATASDSTTHGSLGAGGSAGAEIQAYCFDPVQFNFRGAVLSVGAAGAGAAAGAAGNPGGNTTFTSGFGADWAASTVYSSPQYIIPLTGNAGGYTFVSLSGGTSGLSAPTWVQIVGTSTAADGTVSGWLNIGTATYATTTSYIAGAITQPSSGNPNASYFRALMPGATATTGSVAPSSWPQSPLQYVQDGGIIWENIGAIITMRAGGGLGGPAGTAPATQAAVAPAGNNSSTLTGPCIIEKPTGAIGRAAGSLYSATVGLSGAGGNSRMGDGGSPRAVNGASTQQNGVAATGNGAGGGGGVSANNNSGAATIVGGAGSPGAYEIQQYLGAAQ